MTADERRLKELEAAVRAFRIPVDLFGVVSETDAALLLSVSKRSLERWRHDKHPGAPKCQRVGGRYRYQLRHLAIYLGTVDEDQERQNPPKRANK